MGFFWWRREITSSQQRELLRAVYHLGEEILTAPSSAEILGKIVPVLPKVLKVTGAKLYLHDRGRGALTVVGESPASAISLEAPAGLVQTSAVTCFQNRMVLSIPTPVGTLSNQTKAPSRDPSQRVRFYSFR